MSNRKRNKKPKIDVNQKLVRLLLDKHRSDISIGGCETIKGTFSNGWQRVALGFPKSRKEALEDAVAMTLQKIRTDWTLILFVFHVDEQGNKDFETEELLYHNSTVQELDEIGTETIREMLDSAEDTKRSSGWYAVPSHDFTVEGRYMDFFKMWDEHGVWDNRSTEIKED